MLTNERWGILKTTWEELLWETERARLCEQNLVKAGERFVQAFRANDTVATERAFLEMKLAVAQCREK